MRPVDIVIPVSDKNDDITHRCLAHLERTQKYPYNIILVEDKGPSFTFGKSVNRGIREADSEIIIGMDSDSFPEPGAIKRLLNFAEKYPQVGYFGVRIRNYGFVESLGWIYSNNPLHLIRMMWWTRAPLYYLKIIRERGVFHWGLRLTKKFVKGMVGQATCLYAIRKECWEDIGGFDEKFRIGYSDVDLCFRILLSDRWYMTCCPDVTVIHQAHITTKRQKTTGLDSRMEKMFREKWPHKKIMNVVMASKMGKFIIPP